MKITLIQFSALRDGSAKSGLLICGALLESGHDVMVCFASEGPMIEEYRALGCEVGIVSHKNWLRDGNGFRALRNALKEWRVGRKFASRLKSHCPDLVYVNTAASYAGAVAAAKLGVPCIWHLRELFDDVGGDLFCPSWMRPWVRRKFLRISDRVVVNSRAVAENLLCEKAGSAVVIPNAISDKFLEETGQRNLRTSLGLANQDLVVGIPGTLRQMKGHRFALHALEGLLAEDPRLKILVSGDARDAFGRELIEEFSKIDCASHVLWVGNIVDMRDFYSSCDIVVIPSSSEAFGRTVIESMACGLPVIATRVGGIPEIIDDGENGLLVEYGAEQSLREALLRLLGDDALSRRLGRSAKEKARLEYSEKVHAGRILESVEQALLEK